MPACCLHSRRMLVMAGLGLACAGIALAGSAGTVATERNPPRTPAQRAVDSPAVVVPTASPDIRAFRPSKHGFWFENNFYGTSLPINPARIGERLGAPSQYGLCGGMSFAAADFFLASRATPKVDQPPRRHSSLFNFLTKRQIDSLGDRLSLGAKFSRWMLSPDLGLIGTAAMTLDGLDAIVDDLRAGQPVVLGLVLRRSAMNRDASGPVGQLWDNHQVLAYDVEPTRPFEVNLKIYDPNYPADDAAAIHMAIVEVSQWTVPGWGGGVVSTFGVVAERRVTGSRPTRIRGVFAMPYSPSIPPAGL